MNPLTLDTGQVPVRHPVPCRFVSVSWVVPPGRGGSSSSDGTLRSGLYPNDGGPLSYVTTLRPRPSCGGVPVPLVVVLPLSLGVPDEKINSSS